MTQVRADASAGLTRQLVTCFEDRNVHGAEKVLRDNASLLSDPFIQLHLAELLRSLRSQYILELSRPYSHLVRGMGRSI